MSDPALAIQKALVAAIRALNTDAGTNVYDRVPEGTPYPRVNVGEGQTTNSGELPCFDATESFWTIDAWSREPGYVEVKRIASAIRVRLHDGALVLEGGHVLDLMLVDSTEYNREDGLTSRARMIVRTITHPDTEESP